MNDSKIIGVIPAAGYSSRMNSLKALYPIDTDLIIERTVSLLKEGGIDIIYVVSGYKRNLIEKALAEHKVTIVSNPGFDSGMFSSVRAAVESFPSDTDGFLFLPVDYPFVQPETIKKLTTAFAESEADIVSPRCCGTTGHPPVIRKTVFSSISMSSGEGGLRAVLTRPEFSSLKIETDDEGILDDVDDDEDYLRLMAKYHGRMLNYPLSAEINDIRLRRGLPPELCAHMDKVNDIAVGFCEELNASGARLNPGLLGASCRLHDICKAEPEHAAAAEKLLIEMGYPAVAAIVSKHMKIDFAADSPLDEAALLYLADKLVEGCSLMKLEDRMKMKLEQFKGNTQAEKNIRNRFEKAVMIMQRVRSVSDGIIK